MALGQRLRQVRQAAGLSQRQLCGETITRNMLSQIENGSARPSMDTLQYLAARLGKPVSFFLEEQPVASANLALMQRAREAAPGEAVELLKDYQGPDPVFDRERWLLEAVSHLALARQAIGENRMAYARELLDRAAAAGAATPYYTPEMERTRRVLLYEAGGDPAELAANLPDLTDELLLRAAAALKTGAPRKCIGLLQAAKLDPRCQLLLGDAHMALGDYVAATACYLQAEAAFPQKVYGKLEQCYRELEDYKQAYHYACKQRET